MSCRSSRASAVISSGLGRILRRYGEEARNDVETQKEFELLGAQVAVPILDRENLLGVAVFDGRITGEPLVNSELELIFHLLEQLALAIKNIWLHDQLAGNHQMMADILRELSSACVVVSRDLTILHANKMARKYFAAAGPPRRRPGVQRPAPDPWRQSLPGAQDRLGDLHLQVRAGGFARHALQYQHCPVPTRAGWACRPRRCSWPKTSRKAEQLQRLEIEAANLRLVKTMADRLTHEIGNALVPLSHSPAIAGGQMARTPSSAPPRIRRWPTGSNASRG